MAVPAAIFRGACPLVYACRAVGVPVGTYIGRALLPAILAAAGPMLLLGLITMWWTPSNWPGLFACGAAYVVLYLGVAGIGLFGIQVWRDLARRVIGTKRGPELVDAVKEHQAKE